MRYWVNPSKREEWMGFSEGWQGCSEGNPKEQPCQPEESPLHHDSFFSIYILIKIGHFGDISDFFKYSYFKKHNSCLLCRNCLSNQKNIHSIALAFLCT